METIVKSEKEIGVIINKPITLRQVIREVLNTSYNGHNEGCLNCAEINDLVDHFLQGGRFKIYKIKESVMDSRGRDIEQDCCHYFMRKEFAEEKIQELKKADEADNKFNKASYKYNYKIEEIDVKI